MWVSGKNLLLASCFQKLLNLMSFMQNQCQRMMEVLRML